MMGGSGSTSAVAGGLARHIPVLIHPVLGRSIQELLETCPDPLAVERLTTNEQTEHKLNK